MLNIFKFSFLILILSIISIVNCYNYGENQATGYSLNGQLTEQQPTRGQFLKPNGFNQPTDQDGLYISRNREQLRAPLQRTPTNFRSESSIAVGIPNSGSINGDLAIQGERTNERNLLPTLSNVPRSGLPRMASLPTNLRGAQDVSLSKNERSSSSQVQATGTGSGDSSLSPSLQIGRSFQRPTHSGSNNYHRHQHQTLEQLLNHKSADKFLGPGFIQQQLLNQKGENKFLTIHGKEEREINGTIELKKNGLVNANIEEIKDGKFQVLDRDHNKVGDVSSHIDVEKHLKMTENNGITNVELEKNSNAELNVERNIDLGPRIYGQSNPDQKRHVRVHLEQNLGTRAQVEISKNVQAQRPDNNRFRRDAQATNEINNLP